MITIRGLTQHYGVRPVLKNVDLDIETGELVAVVGSNGTGKSTLLAAMAGLLSPQQGYIEFDGRRRRRTEQEELAIRKETVYLPASPWLPSQMTGRQFLLAVGRLYEVDHERLFDHIDRLFSLFNLNGMADTPIASYSTGQAKKLAVAGLLVTDATTMIIDEPFGGGLDPAALSALRKVLLHLGQRKDVTVILAAPVPELIEGLARRVAVLQNGSVLAYDTVEGLRQRTGCDGTLEEVLERLTSPQTADQLAAYFEKE